MPSRLPYVFGPGDFRELSQELVEAGFTIDDPADWCIIYVTNNDRGISMFTKNKIKNSLLICSISPEHNFYILPQINGNSFPFYSTFRIVGIPLKHFC